MATIQTISSIKTPSSAYRVELIINGIKTPVNVFANSPSEATANARAQINPSSGASLAVVSVTAINACSGETPPAKPVIVERPINPSDGY